MEIDIAFQVDRTGLKYAGWHDYASATSGMTGGDGFANSFGIVCSIVRPRPIVGDLEISRGKLRRLDAREDCGNGLPTNANVLFRGRRPSRQGAVCPKCGKAHKQRCREQ